MYKYSSLKSEKICTTGYKDKDIEKNYQALARRGLLLIWAYYVDDVDMLLKVYLMNIVVV